MMEPLMKIWSFDLVAWRGFLFSALILNFIFTCQLFFLQPLVSALDAKPGDAAALFERVTQNVKVKK
uniref:Uncharacterized protein n=1 Tax=Solanum lycopersicum TaxID=4081 RepID=A0A3Q7HNW1_SOLLC